MRTLALLPAHLGLGRVVAAAAATAVATAAATGAKKNIIFLLINLLTGHPFGAGSLSLSLSPSAPVFPAPPPLVEATERRRRVAFKTSVCDSWAEAPRSAERPIQAICPGRLAPY